MSHCCVPGCKVRRKPGVQVYMARFPTPKKNSTLREQWINIISKYSPKEMWEPTSYDVVCENHFDSNQWETDRVDGTRKIKRYSAVPTLFVGLNIRANHQNVYDKVLQSSDNEVGDNKNIDSDVEEMEPISKTGFAHNFTSKIVQNPIILNLDDYNNIDSDVEEMKPISKTGFAHNITSKIVQSPIILNLDDYDNVCRTCGDHGDFLSLFEQNTEKLTFADMIMEVCTSIQINRNDGFPENICPKCVALVIELFAFKRRCEALDQLFNLSGMKSNCINTSEMRESQVKNELLEEFNEDSTRIIEIPSPPKLEKELRPLKCPLTFEPILPKYTEAVLRKEKIQNPEIVDESINNRKCPKRVDCQKYKCDICEREFRLSKYLKKHMIMHEEHYPFKCNLCEKQYKRSDSLTTHSRIHTGERPYVCEYCQKSFVLKKYLTGHLLSVHHTDGPKELNPENYKFKCDKCDKRYETDRLLYRHDYYHHKDKFLCSDCGKVFKNKPQLNKHSAVHTGVKAYSCQICAKKFAFKCALGRHVLIHSGEKRYECNVCQRKFTLYSNMQSHMRSHTGIRPYKCVICEKAFSFKTTLRKHTQTHRGESSDISPVVNKRFYD